MMKKNLIKKTEIASLCKKLKKQNKKIIFTNGVFDILHRGHVEYLTKAKSFGDILIVGLNSDASVRRIKGKNRPINNQIDRAIVLLALKSVDYVVLFGEDTPLVLIKQVFPDVLVKGSDYKVSEIVGADFVQQNGGVVKTVLLTKGRSTTNTLNRLKQR